MLDDRRYALPRSRALKQVGEIHFIECTSTSSAPRHRKEQTQKVRRESTDEVSIARGRDGYGITGKHTKLVINFYFYVFSFLFQKAFLWLWLLNLLLIPKIQNPGVLNDQVSFQLPGGQVIHLLKGSPLFLLPMVETF